MSGLYGIVRHPAYAAIMICVFGFSLWMDDAVRVIVTIVLFIFFDIKSKVEEKWLEKIYPEYADYKKRVTKKFIPWIY